MIGMMLNAFFLNISKKMGKITIVEIMAPLLRSESKMNI